MPRDSRGYEFRMVAILCVAFGILTTEIFGIGFLAPFIARDLALNNVQMGALFSGFWVTYSISSYLAGFITDRWGERKPVLLASLDSWSRCFLCCRVLPPRSTPCLQRECSWARWWGCSCPLRRLSSRWNLRATSAACLHRIAAKSRQQSARGVSGAIHHRVPRGALWLARRFFSWSWKWPWIDVLDSRGVADT